jgi:hypothetical protein
MVCHFALVTGLVQFFVSRQLQRQLVERDDLCGNTPGRPRPHGDLFRVARQHDQREFAFQQCRECGGYALATPDGKVRVSGICTRKMNDGASERDVFAMEPGAERGTWKQVAGTGALADKHYSGWWKSVISDGKAEMGIWGGNCNYRGALAGYIAFQSNDIPLATSSTLMNRPTCSRVNLACRRWPIARPSGIAGSSSRKAHQISDRSNRPEIR